MSTKTVNHGGQRRTAQLTCGFIIKGHPTEVDKKTARHWRYCDECDMKDKDKSIPTFSKTNADINGWGGLNGGGNKGLSHQRASHVTVGLGSNDLVSSNVVTHFEDGVIMTKSDNIALSDEELIALFAVAHGECLPKSKKTAKK